MDHRVLSWQQRHGFALSFVLALAVALFAFPIAAHAADEAGNVFSISSSNPSSIEGDLYWIGRALDLDSTTVGQDVLAAGETLDIDNTQVGGSIRTAGKTINISKTSVDGNLTLAGQHVTVDKSSSAAGAYIAAQDINLSSSVKTAALYGETVILDGTVTGNVSIYAEKLIITKNASLLGNVEATLSEKPTIDDNAHIERPINVTFDKAKGEDGGAAQGIASVLGSIMGYLFSGISTAVIALIIAWILPRAVNSSADIALKQPSKIIVPGMLALIAIVPMLFMIIVAAFGIPVTGILSFTTIQCAILCILTCIPFASASLAPAVLNSLPRQAATVVGGFVAGVANHLPFIGFVIGIASFIYLAGYAIHCIGESMKGNRPQPPAGDPDSLPPMPGSPIQ